VRLGYALELNDLIEFDIFAGWIRKLMKGLNKDSLLQETTLSINDCIHAHDMLFKMMEEETRGQSIRRGLTNGASPMERALTKAMDSQLMERLLLPREGSRRGEKPTKATKREEPTGKSGNQKRKERIVAAATKEKNDEIKRLKEQLGHRTKPKGDSKGGKGKGKDKGKAPPLPKEMREGGKHRGMSLDGRKICYGYNLPKGCTECEPGKQCKKGWHICSIDGCKETHSATICPKK
jgi:hypothetical protein